MSGYRDMRGPTRRAIMRRACLGALLALLCALAFAPRARANVLVEKWAQTPGGSPDGIALGDMDGDGRLEIALVLRGGTFTAGNYTPDQGSLVVLNYDGSVRFQVQTGQQIVGFPVFGDFDGDSFAEVAFCEVSDSGYCYVYDDGGALLFQVGPLWYPSMTNGGPVVADINGDGYDDLIVVSSAGEVQAVYGPSGAAAWSYDLYDAHGDWPFGHAALGDIDGDKKPELVIGGAQRGGIYVLNAEDGTEQWVAPNLYATYENYFYGSGPMLMNLDADPQLEIVGAMAGYPGPAAVLALDTDGSVLWRTPITADQLMYTSPAAADTDGDGKPEIFVQALDGTLVQLRAADGAVLAQKSLGADSWSTPGFVDIDFDGRMEIVTSTLSSTSILDSQLNVLDHYDDSNAGLFPPPVVGDTDKNGKLDLVTGAWYPQQVVSIPLPYTSAFSWSGYEGSAQHAGSVPVASPETLLGSNVAPAVVIVLNELVNAVAATSGSQQSNLKTARNDLDLGYRSYLQGNPHTAVDYLKQAVAAIESAKSAGYPAASVANLEQQISYEGTLMFQQYIDRTSAIAGPTKSQVQSALTTLATAQSQYVSANYAGAIQTADSGATTLRNFLDNGSYTVGSYCPTALGEVYLAWECRIIAVRDQVETLLQQYRNDRWLTRADNDLRGCVVWGPDLVFDQAYPYCQNADNDLARFSRQDPTALRSSLAFAVMRNTRLYIDDATTWFASVDPSALSMAESSYAGGVSQYNAGDFASAHDSFDAAYNAARPCTGGSFGNPVQGLMGGGCHP